MTEEVPIFEDGDVVWVKLGSCWWPGEVTTNAPEDLNMKVAPLAIVKFFNEDTYEFVKNHNHIFYYNCERKNEFIRKGMNSFRANNAHMKKFPGDVTLAEVKTDGNPNILSDPMFLPQQKSNLEIFGRPSPKKKSKEAFRGRLSKRSSPKKPSKIHITHRRFLGYDDYEARIRIQYPGKDSAKSGDEEEVSQLNQEPPKVFPCGACSYKTDRLEVMLFHVQCHIKGCKTLNSKKKSPTRAKRPRVVQKLASSSSDDEQVSSVSREDSEEEVEPPKPKKKKAVSHTKPKPKKEPAKPKQPESTKPENDPKVTNEDITKNLLAEWSDDEENVSQEDASKSSESETSVKEKSVEETEEVDAKKDDESIDNQTKDLIKSCFDFEEEEEETDIVPVGRKIPRVIPQSDKSKSSDPCEEDADLPTAEDDLNRMEVLQDGGEDFKDLMDATSVPELPDIPGQNFSPTKPVKIPDKTEVATKLTNPKKRFVKSFEDFEEEQRKAQELEEQKKQEIDDEREKERRKAQEEKKKLEKEKEQREAKELEEQKKLEEEQKRARELEELNKLAKDKDEKMARELEAQKKLEKEDALLLQKLKCQIMSKMGEEDSVRNETKTHRSPRSKILENYRKKNTEESSSEKVEAEVEEKGKEDIPDEERVVIEEVLPDPDETPPQIEDEIQTVEKIAEPEEKVEETVTEKIEEEPEQKVEEIVTEKIEEPETKIEEPEKKVEEIATEKIEEKVVTEKIEDQKLQIDEYLNDFLFNFEKKETPPKEKENEVHLKFNDDDDIAIKTNLTNLYKNEEEMSALNTLAMVSETIVKPPEIDELIPKKAENELVPIDGNLTKVSEKDLADGQVEITADVKKPVTLTNFSMDFSEEQKVEICDVEEQIPQQVVDKSKPQLKSRLLERLTDQPKSKVVIKSKSGKPIILSDKLMKPSTKPEEIVEGSVSVQKITTKLNLNDADDVDRFIIQKEAKKDIVTPPIASKEKTVKTGGKAKILQQTIITPAGEIIQPSSSKEDVFDINAMPIVLSDQILTPESIENMPIFLSDAPEKKKSPPPKILADKTPKLLKATKIVGPKILKQNNLSKQKFVIVTQSPPTPTRFTVGKKPTTVKRDGTPLAKIQTSEPTGNKVMILTDQRGEQQKVLLTPAQQKLIGYQGNKVAKTIVKGNILQKSKDSPATPVAGSSGIFNKAISTGRLTTTTQTFISTGLTSQQKLRIEKTIPQRKLQIQSPRVSMKSTQKTILIKNQHGQTVRRIQGNDDALLDQQVAEQLEAIKASGSLQKDVFKGMQKVNRRSYVKKEMPRPVVKPIVKPEATLPPLAPISPKKPEVEKAENTDRPLNQLVIQDAMGNQTTITEGQILALPSETVDGQPQSYMLVTLDESGNLTPLNNEALMSLDPNLGLGDIAQIEQTKEEVKPKPEIVKPEVVPEPVKTEIKKIEEPVPVTDSNQQLIVTGDPIAAQKFLETLTEGNTDLANILASAEGSSILIHADGQQILINTDSDNQMLLAVNPESSEGGGNPIFASQPKNQDILAAALADTDVFQQEQNAQSKPSQLSPSSTLYPMNVSNVLETSLTLNSPIMTPLEVPSTNSKKVADEADILNQIPKNVDLPITITDPNISQTVNQQQVALMNTELQNNLELTLPLSESSITAPSSEMNSPSFVYSLPTLDDDVQKPFNSSMPLLTEDSDETSKDKEKKDKNEFLVETEGLCTLGGEMCSSLSEPPPDMFDLSAVLSQAKVKEKEEDSSESLNTNEDSCEIPVQPEIVTSLNNFEATTKRPSDDSVENDSKKCKFD